MAQYINHSSVILKDDVKLFFLICNHNINIDLCCRQQLSSGPSKGWQQIFSLFLPYFPLHVFKENFEWSKQSWRIWVKKLRFETSKPFTIDCATTVYPKIVKKKINFQKKANHSRIIKSRLYAAFTIILPKKWHHAWLYSLHNL